MATLLPNPLYFDPPPGSQHKHSRSTKLFTTLKHKTSSLHLSAFRSQAKPEGPRKQKEKHGISRPTHIDAPSIPYYAPEVSSPRYYDPASPRLDKPNYDGAYTPLTPSFGNLGGHLSPQPTPLSAHFSPQPTPLSAHFSPLPTPLNAQFSPLPTTLSPQFSPRTPSFARTTTLQTPPVSPRTGSISVYMPARPSADNLSLYSPYDPRPAPMTLNLPPMPQANSYVPIAPQHNQQHESQSTAKPLPPTPGPLDGEAGWFSEEGEAAEGYYRASSSSSSSPSSCASVEPDVSDKAARRAPPSPILVPVRLDSGWSVCDEEGSGLVTMKPVGALAERRALRWVGMDS